MGSEPRWRGRSGALVALLLSVGCGAPGREASVPRAPVVAETVAVEPAVVEPSPPEPSLDLYTLEEAFADVMASPLAFIGTGEWTGVAPYPPCAYKNDRVIVLDNYCTTKKEISTFGVDVYSPTRGWFEIYATAKGKQPVSSTPRAEYGSFLITSGPVALPGQVKAELSFDMTYADVERYEGLRAGANLPACWEGVHAEPASGCSQGVPASVAAAFRASYQDFMRDPPPSWYAFARTIVGARRHPWPKPENFQVTPDYLRGRAVDFARQNGVHLMQSQWQEVGNTKGIFVTISATPDGGFFLLGNRVPVAGRGPDSGVPVVLRVDDRGDIVWETSLVHRDFFDFEASSLAPTPDGGVIAHVLSYKSAGVGATNRLVKLDGAGAIVWDWEGRGNGGPDTPFAVTLQLTRKGMVEMTGHVYLPGAKVEHAWTGRVDAKSGALVSDKVGKANPYGRKTPN